MEQLRADVKNILISLAGEGEGVIVVRIRDPAGIEVEHLLGKFGECRICVLNIPYVGIYIQWLYYRS